MAELLGLPYSPWSEKARWALDVRHVPYTETTYAPLLGEPGLRIKLRKWTGTVSVPVLTADDGSVIGDSADIARWADGRGDGPTMFPRELASSVSHFVGLSERGLAAGRALSLRRMLASEDALLEMVPRPLRRSFPRASTRLAALGIRRTLRKYGADRDATDEPLAALVTVLDALRDAVNGAEGSPKTLLGELTFADIAMAQVLCFVEPPKTGLHIGRASRASFTDPVQKARYGDLLAWRDALYDAYRCAKPA